MSTADSFVGHFASGKRVYVRRLKSDKSDAPIVFAVFADIGRNGKLVLVQRFRDQPGRHEDRQMYCANGFEHGKSACHWTRVPEPISPHEAARWAAHWWTHVVEGVRAEVVALRPTGVAQSTVAESAHSDKHLPPHMRGQNLYGPQGNDVVGSQDMVTISVPAELEARRQAIKALHCSECYDIMKSAPKRSPCGCSCHR